MDDPIYNMVDRWIVYYVREDGNLCLYGSYNTEHYANLAITLCADYTKKLPVAFLDKIKVTVPDVPEKTFELALKEKEH